MSWIDWVIALTPITVCAGLALYTRRYMRSIADFMSGGRCAGRYMLATARSEHTSGALSLVAQLQILLVAGFTVYWWQQINTFVALMVAVSGFVIYRYRQTRAMTLAQFFEMRYSRRFRLFAGVLAVFGGLINFGLGPIVVSRFFVYFLQLPVTVHLGGMEVRTELLMMAGLLGLAVLMATTGGQVTVMLTDSIEGVLTLFLFTFIVIMIFLTHFDWGQVKTVLVNTAPGHSYVDPFDTGDTKKFNLWYVLMQIFLMNTSILAFQHNSAFNSSALTPHESRMGFILGQWKSYSTQFLVMLLGICTLTYLQHAVSKDAVNQALARIEDKDILRQMRGPVALSMLLPIGAKGALLAATLMGTVAQLDMHLHSWGSIFVQDVLMPLRKTPLPLQRHLTLLRCCIVGVAVWGFLFGITIPLTEELPLLFAITQAIFTSGAGCAIIGGLYWNRGTAQGAWTGMILGAVLTLGGGVWITLYKRHTGHDFVLNAQHFAFIATGLSILTYIVVSLLTCRQPHNMDKLLHRGEYAVATDAVAGVNPGRGSWLTRALGIQKDFPRRDRWTTYLVSGWGFLWFVVFVVGSLLYLWRPWSKEAWMHYWMAASIFLPLLLGVGTTIWFAIGCTRDLKVFFQRLRTQRVDEEDDGMVRNSSH